MKKEDSPPKPAVEHNALHDARWNMQLFQRCEAALVMRDLQQILPGNWPSERP